MVIGRVVPLKRDFSPRRRFYPLAWKSYGLEAEPEAASLQQLRPPAQRASGPAGLLVEDPVFKREYWVLDFYLLKIDD